MILRLFCLVIFEKGGDFFLCMFELTKGEGVNRFPSAIVVFFYIYFIKKRYGEIRVPATTIFTSNHKKKILFTKNHKQSQTKNLIHTKSHKITKNKSYSQKITNNHKK